VAQDLCDAFDRKAGKEVGTSRKLITFVDDRPGHDQRYAIDPSLLEDHLGWQTQTPWQKGLDKTLEAYL
jgi:dTDP-glucose 4,6-dehydratase